MIGEDIAGIRMVRLLFLSTRRITALPVVLIQGLHLGYGI